MRLTATSLAIRMVSRMMGRALEQLVTLQIARGQLNSHSGCSSRRVSSHTAVLAVRRRNGLSGGTIRSALLRKKRDEELTAKSGYCHRVT